MAKFEHLIGDTFVDSDWKSFHRNYPFAALVHRGERLARDVRSVGLSVVWSTTRMDQFMSQTWQWLISKNLPAGPIQSRHLIRDGQRPAIDVKLRHWWEWSDKNNDRNPIIAWIDDDPIAVNVLRSNGCPAWTPKELERAIKRAENGTPLTVLLAGPIPPAALARNFATSRPQWEARETGFQARRAVWWAERRRLAAETQARSKQRRQDGPPSRRPH